MQATEQSVPPSPAPPSGVGQREAHRYQPCIVPRLIVIDNAYANRASAAAQNRPVQGTAPLEAALGTYDARSDRELAMAADAIQSAANAAAKTCGGAGTPLNVGPSLVVIHPSASPGTQAPLGWTLSSSSVDSMRLQVAGNIADEDSTVLVLRAGVPISGPTFGALVRDPDSAWGNTSGSADNTGNTLASPGERLTRLRLEPPPYR